jgi:integrase
MGTMNAKLKSAEHLEEIEVNKLLKYLIQKEIWIYYALVRLGISTALRYSDLSQIQWGEILEGKKLIIKEKKTNRVREIPLNQELVESLTSVYLKLGSPEKNSRVIPLTIRGVNKQLKIYANKSGIKGKRVSSHTFRKTFGREVWKRNNYSEASLVKLSELFRHSSTSITRIYLSITKEEVENLYDIQDLFVY